jgi:hypothetical protein
MIPAIKLVQPTRSEKYGIPASNFIRITWEDDSIGLENLGTCFSARIVEVVPWIHNYSDSSGRPSIRPGGERWKQFASLKYRSQGAIVLLDVDETLHSMFVGKLAFREMMSDTCCASDGRIDYEIKSRRIAFTRHGEVAVFYIPIFTEEKVICPKCKGTGVVSLFNSNIECGCNEKAN